MLLALTLCVSSALPVTEVPRPGGPLKEPLVQVLLSENEVNIEPGGGQARFKALDGMLLQKSDVVVVGPGAWVALFILGNEHVVRLDDDLSLAVGDLALLNAPKQTRTVVQQLDALLTAKERSRNERLIGWHASQTAANTQPVQLLKVGGGSKTAKSSETRSRNSEKETDDMPAMKSSPGAPPPKPTVAAAPPPPAPAPPPPVAQVRPTGGGTEEAVKAKQKTEPRPIDPALQSCVDLSVAAWGPEVKAKLGTSLLIQLKTRDGEPVVKLPLGLPAPQCLGDYFKTRGTISPSWTSLTVPLI